MMKKDGNITRRNYLKLCGSTAATAAMSAAAPGLFLGCYNDSPEYIILKNGLTYIDGTYVKRDIMIRSGVVFEIAAPLTLADKYASLVKKKDAEIIDCSSYYVSPGWVDMHCHIGGMGVALDYLGPKMGVTALVDAGTYGPKTFDTFLKSYWEKSEIPLFSFLNLRKDGITLLNMFTMNDPGVEDVDGAASLAAEYPDIIRGLKVRIDNSNTSKSYPTYLSDATARLGKELGLPVMYHLGDPQGSTGRPLITDFLANIKQGDIITHFLRSTTNCIFDGSWSIRPEVEAAKKLGVLFDVGHGLESFMFDTAAAALDRGFTDFTISSDLHTLSSLSKALTFSNVVSKFLALGLDVADITEKISSRPRRLLNLEPAIALNKRIDMTIFSIKEEASNYYDAESNKLSYNRRIYPEYTIISGKKVRAGGQDRLKF